MDRIVGTVVIIALSAAATVGYVWVCAHFIEKFW
jgi:hypothetical protein